MRRLGVETVPQIVTRGWLVDAHRGVDDIIGLEHLGGIEPTPGDAVLFHTGWGAHWDDPETYLSRRAGTGHGGRGVARRARRRADRLPTPGATARSPPRTAPFEVPQTLNVRHGVFVVENLDTAELAAAGVREFALILTHPKLRGATGAWTSPIALV